MRLKKSLHTKKLNKMILQKSTIFILASAMLIFSSCTKDEDKDVTAPTITFVEPSQTMYGIGVTVPIQLQIEDNEDLHALDIHITNEANSNMIMMSWEHIHENNMMVDTSFVANLEGAMMTNFIIEVNAEDASGNKAVASKTVHIMDM